MSLENAMSVAEELASLAERAPAPETVDPDTLDALLARREALIWKLGSACTPTTLAAAPPDERQRLIATLRRSERATEALLKSVMRVRDASLASLAQLRSTSAEAPRVEPRFTERVA